MAGQESISAVIALKQRILREAPAAARRIEGVDKIFYMGPMPGYDAMLSASGTVSYRDGWGVQSRPTRYGGVIAADKALRYKRYRPYNIFTGNLWQENESRHQFARKDRERQQQVFQPTELPKISKKASENIYYERSEIEYPTMEMPTENNFIPRSMQGIKRKLTWGDINQAMENPLKDIYAHKSEMFRSFPNQQTIPNYAKSQFAALRGMENQLGIPGLGRAPKNKKGNKK